MKKKRLFGKRKISKRKQQKLEKLNEQRVNELQNRKKKLLAIYEKRQATKRRNFILIGFSTLVFVALLVGILLSDIGKIDEAKSALVPSTSEKVSQKNDDKKESNNETPQQTSKSEKSKESNKGKESNKKQNSSAQNDDKKNNESKQNVSSGAFIKAKVTKHVDGDTVHVTLENGETQKIRFIGIDTPETVHPNKDVEFYGQEASDFTKNSIYNKTVYLEKDVSDTDKYGRHLRYVWLEKPKEINESTIKTKMLNGILVAQGYANASTYQPDVKYQDYFTRFQREAKNKNLGLWDEAKLAAFEKANTKQETANKPSSESSNTKPPTNNENTGTSKPETIKTPYIANSNPKSMIFHKADCSSVKDMAERNKVPMETREQAINGGYRPCKRCNP